MKEKIAQIGTFDVENFGDLLFPTVLEYNITKYQIDLFSPRGNCNKPFEEKRYVYPLDSLEEKCRENSYLAIIIGGGDIIRCDIPVSSVYEGMESLLFKTWTLPIIVGKRYDIPVIFNAPGVPFRFNKSMRGMVRELMNSVDIVTVRDQQSAGYFRECGVKNIKVIPDTVLCIGDIFDVKLMERCRQTIREKIDLPEDNTYIVIQHNCCNINNDSYIEYFLKLIKKIVELDLNILYMPIGYVHNDIAFLQKLYSQEIGKQVLISEKLSPEEMCAILAGSYGYIGSSLHGAVVSYVYEKKIICINSEGYSKITGLLETINHPECENVDITKLSDDFETCFNQKMEFDPLIKQRIKEHFSDIQNVISGGKKNGIMPDVLKEYFSLAHYIDDTPDKDFTEANVYFDYGDGFCDESMRRVLYKKTDDFGLFFTLEVPQKVYSVRIDPIESAVIVVDSLKILANGKDTEVIIENKLQMDNSSYIILNMDPSFVIKGNNIRTLDIYLRARKLALNDLQEIVGKIYYEGKLSLQLLQEQMTTEMMKLQSDFSEEIKKEQIIVSEKDTIIKELNKDIKGLEKTINKLNIQVDSLNGMNLGLRNQVGELENEIHKFTNSFCWKITYPIRYIGDGMYRLMQKTYFTQCALEAIKILFSKGPKEVCLACRRFIERSSNSKEAESIIPNKAANNKDGYSPYDAQYQENQVFEGEPDVKMLAFYLPQYHTFPENDEWWGKGFTEWVNVKNGNSRFSGHYQPRVPHKDFGYYSLEEVSILAKQAKLAKEHGIYGFCFYYYWFSGKRLMEKPVDMLLEHPEIDLPFCLCWANENWTRAWDGQNKSVLIAQEYSDKDDEQFMLDLEKYISDSRYIRINGKPLILVYNPGQIPDCHKSFAKWRECAKKIGIGEILIWTCQTANNTAELLNITDCIDAEVEFPPHNMWLESIAVRDVELNGKSAFIYNYQCLVEYETKKMEEEATKVPIHHGCMLAWDNAARRKDAWFTYYAFSLRSLYKWVLAISKRARRDFTKEERFIFINAWNEWGEGTYLEPDEKYGYANINTVSKALFEKPLRDELCIVNGNLEKLNLYETTHRVAVQIHMFYLETLDETIQNLNYIPYDFDCYITTDSQEKKTIIDKSFSSSCQCREYQIMVLENRGRDVAPFIVQMTPVIKRYDYVCHIHSKKTTTGEYGNEWRRYIFRHLFGCTEYMRTVFEFFERDPKLGIIMPETFPVLELQAEWGGNLEGVQNLLNRIDCKVDELPQEPTFPVGNMFWARTDAILPMFTHNIEQNDFPIEQGQVNATIAHQIERSWVYVAASRGYGYKKMFNNFPYKGECMKIKRLGIFVHFDKNNIISSNDVATLKEFSEILQSIIFVTNSKLGKDEINKITDYTTEIVERKNLGMDFGAWKEVLLSKGRKNIAEFDELVLFNNSCYPPVFDIKEMFITMENSNVDFWGNTIFPYSSNGDYIGKSCIYEHLQSYFTVYTKKVLESDTFWKFWETMPEYKNYIDVVANCESQFTKILSDAGFTYAPYIKESYYICQYLQNYSVPYEKPSSLVLLRNAFVKKKCVEYMDEEERIRLKYILDCLQK